MAKRGLKPGCVKTPGSGRKKGTPNKATADIRTLAQQHTPRAVVILAEIMENAESDPARVAAIKELLDRGHGKSAMAPEDKEALDGWGEFLARAWGRKDAA